MCFGMVAFIHHDESFHMSKNRSDAGFVMTVVRSMRM